MRGRALPVSLVSLSLLAGAVAIWPELSAPTSASSEAQVATPVLSVRRVPRLTARVVADGRLQAQLEAVMTDPALAGATEHSCLAVIDADGHPVYARHSSQALIPASTMKLVVATVALARMGPDTRYRTVVRSAAPPEAGVVNGDVWLVGSGDPLLATADFAARAGWMEQPRPYTPMESLADAIVAAGVRHVTGRVVGDESRYDTQRYLPSWKPEFATTPEVGPQSALTVNGGFLGWRPAVPAPAPATHGANTLTRLLRERGVTVGGDGTEGPAPGDSQVLAVIDSPPLAEVVGVMLRDSDNLTAELLVKELGARYGGAGTTAAGLGVLKPALAELGLPSEPLAAADGSGLDRSGRLSCDLLQALLRREGEHGPIGRGLPQAGTDGTLTRRFGGTPAAGRVRAKTGSLEHVVALSGWAGGRDGRSLQFSLVANELPRNADGFSLQDRVVSALATYPDAPPPEELAPEPVSAVP